MSQAKLVPQYLKKTDFPVTGKIISVTEQQGKYSTEYVLNLNVDGLGVYDFTAFGANVNTLIKGFSSETNDWIGRTVLITLDEKAHRVLHVPLVK